MSSRGWIKLHRRIQDHWIYQEKRQFSRYEAWLDLIMLANHADNKTLIDGELVTVKTGSFVTSKRQLCGRWEWSNTKVDKFLDLLQQDEMIMYKSDTKKTVITIVKYEVYHEKEKEKRHENDTETKQKHIKNETETYKQECKELKELKELNTTTTTTREEISDAIVFYQENIGVIRPIIAEEILDWINDFGDVMVIEAMNRSLARNKPNWGYAKSILQSWMQKGIKTIEQAKAEEVEFQNQQQLRRTNFRPVNQSKPEIIPDWFSKQKQERHTAENDLTDEQKREKEEMAALLQKYAKEG